MPNALRSTVCATLLLLGLAPAHAQAPAKPPAAVQAEIDEMLSSCRGAGGKPQKSPDLLRVADLTGDGVADYVIDQGSFICEGAASLYSGSGGSQVLAYVGTPDGKAAMAFSSGSFGIKLDQDARPARLHVIVGGPMCGQRVTQNTPRSAYKSCWRPVAWDAKKRKLDFAPVSQVQFIQ